MKKVFSIITFNPWYYLFSGSLNDSNGNFDRPFIVVDLLHDLFSYISIQIFIVWFFAHISSVIEYFPVSLESKTSSS